MCIYLFIHMRIHINTKIKFFKNVLRKKIFTPAALKSAPSSSSNQISAKRKCYGIQEISLQAFKWSLCIRCNKHMRSSVRLLHNNTESLTAKARTLLVSHCLFDSAQRWSECVPSKHFLIKASLTFLFVPLIQLPQTQASNDNVCGTSSQFNSWVRSPPIEKQNPLQYVSMVNWY